MRKFSCRFPFHRAATASLLALSAALAGAPFAAQAATTFTKIVDINVTAPEQGKFTSFQPASVEGNNVVFKAAYGNNTAGLYSATVSPVGLSRIVDYSVTAPTGGNYSNFGDYPSLSGNSIAFFARSNGSTGPTGIFAGTTGSTTVTTVASTSTTPTTPTGGSPAGVFTSFGGNAGISGSNVVFGGVTATTSGIYSGTTAATGAATIADTNLTVPNQPSLKFSSFGGQPGISGNTVFFRGSNLNGSPVPQGIYTGTVGIYGAVRVADTFTAVPGRSVNFSGSSAFSIAPAINGTNLAFRGGFNDGSPETGIYRGAVGSMTLTAVTDTLTDVPGLTKTKFTSFNGNVSLNANGDLAFLGNYTGGAGIFLSSGTSITALISVNDMLFGDKVSGLTLSNDAMDGGRLAFGYTLTNGISGIAVADFVSVPEPSTWLAGALAVCGAAGAAARRRRA